MFFLLFVEDEPPWPEIGDGHANEFMGVPMGNERPGRLMDHAAWCVSELMVEIEPSSNEHINLSTFLHFLKPLLSIFLDHKNLLLEHDRYDHRRGSC